MSIYGYNKIKILKGSIAMKIITDEILKRFEQYLYEEERSESTIEKYMRDVKLFYKAVGSKELKKTDVLEYKKSLCEK